MTWFRIDDRFGHHPKLEKMEGDATTHALAVAAWTLMGADCAARRTDGKFSPARLRRVLPWGEKLIARASEALLGAGLWERKDPSADTISFHDWLDYQPSAAELEEEKRLATERQKRWRKARRIEKSGDVDALRDAYVTGPRPVPSDPEKKESRSLETEASEHVTQRVTSRPNGALLTALANGTAEMYRDAKLSPPNETRELTWDGWHKLAVAVGELATTNQRDVTWCAQRLVREFLSDPKMQLKGFPIGFLANNPNEFWRAL